MSHSLFDGPAAHNFFRAWASKSAIMKEKGGLEQQKPVHERGTLLMSSYEASNVTGKPPSQNSNTVTRAAAIDHLYQLIMQAATDQHLPEVGRLNQKECLLRTFHLSSQMIEGLRREVLGGRGGSFSCSSFEVVAAHLWKVLHINSLPSGTSLLARDLSM